MGKITYKKSGVDIKKGDDFAKGIKSIFGQNKIDNLAAFGSLFELKDLLKKYKSPLFVSSADGVGTKLLLAQHINKHNTVGVDLVAMNVNDIVCLGAKPLFFLDYIACGKVRPKILLKVAEGIKSGLKKADCALLGGETAEMPGMYSVDEYDLAGFCVGIVDKAKIINGKNIKTGDLIIGIESSGLHSNGYSLARLVFLKNGIKKYTKKLLEPTRIYVKPILSLLKSLGPNSKAVKGIAHVTGGAFYNKVTKILPKNLGMVIDKKSWPVPKIFKVLQKEGNITQKEMYSVFNMGIGMVLVVDKKYCDKILKKLNKSYKSYLIGEVRKTSQKMRLI